MTGRHRRRHTHRHHLALTWRHYRRAVARWLAEVPARRPIVQGVALFALFAIL